VTGRSLGDRLHAPTARDASALAVFAPKRAAARRGQASNRGLALCCSGSRGGREGFYAGETARGLATFSRAGGGFSTQRICPRSARLGGEPLSGSYRGIEFSKLLATQGFTVLEMLNLIEPYEIGGMDPLGASSRTSGAGEADRLSRP